MPCAWPPRRCVTLPPPPRRSRSRNSTLYHISKEKRTMAVSGSVIGNYVGASVKRVEDPRFLTGQGRYVDDLKFPNMAHAAFLRSPYSHARITVDASEARALPGVVAVFTAADLVGVVNPIQIDASLPGAKPLPHTALASDKVRFVGDPIAMVVADSRYIAEDAIDLIQVDYDPLPPVPGMDVALDPTSATSMPGTGGK